MIKEVAELSTSSPSSSPRRGLSFDETYSSTSPTDIGVFKSTSNKNIVDPEERGTLEEILRGAGAW